MFYLCINIIIKILKYDLYSTILTYLFIGNLQKYRWFLLHAFSNYYIMTNSFNDLKYCLLSPSLCSNTYWINTSYNSFLMCTCIHIYHCLFFKLTKDDILHHLIMLCIAGPLSLFSKKISITSSLFFLSGLPGFIDYTILWIFKLFNLDNTIRKKIYTYTNLIIRSPGCIILTYINMLNITKINCILSVILFWNGQYYLNQSIHNYYKNNI